MKEKMISLNFKNMTTFFFFYCFSYLILIWKSYISKMFFIKMYSRNIFKFCSLIKKIKLLLSVSKIHTFFCTKCYFLIPLNYLYMNVLRKSSIFSEIFYFHLLYCFFLHIIFSMSKFNLISVLKVLYLF